MRVCLGLSKSAGSCVNPRARARAVRGSFSVRRARPRPRALDARHPARPPWQVRPLGAHQQACRGHTAPLGSRFVLRSNHAHPGSTEEGHSAQEPALSALAPAPASSYPRHLAWSPRVKAGRIFAGGAPRTAPTRAHHQRAHCLRVRGTI